MHVILLSLFNLIIARVHRDFNSIKIIRNNKFLNEIIKANYKDTFGNEKDKHN